MSATIIQFPRRARARKDLVIAQTEGGFTVAIALEETAPERDFATTFQSAGEARAWAGEVLATWDNVFASVVDLTGTAA